MMKRKTIFKASSTSPTLFEQANADEYGQEFHFKLRQSREHLSPSSCLRPNVSVTHNLRYFNIFALIIFFKFQQQTASAIESTPAADNQYRSSGSQIIPTNYLEITHFRIIICLQSNLLRNIHTRERFKIFFENLNFSASGRLFHHKKHFDLPLETAKIACIYLLWRMSSHYQFPFLNGQYGTSNTKNWYKKKLMKRRSNSMTDLGHSKYKNSIILVKSGSEMFFHFSQSSVLLQCR